MSKPSKNGRKTADGKFAPGNSYGKGRPEGSRNKATLAIQALLDGEAENLTRKAVEMALAGDTTALRLCLERLCPPRKERPISVKLPKVDKAEGTVKAMGAVFAAVASGEITPGEGQSLTAMVEGTRKAMETGQLELRLAALEKHLGIKR